MTRKERILIVIAALTGFLAFWVFGWYQHHIAALCAFAVPAFLFFVWVPYRKQTGLFAKENGDKS